MTEVPEKVNVGSSFKQRHSLNVFLARRYVHDMRSPQRRERIQEEQKKKLSVR